MVCEVSLWLGAAREPTRPARVGLEETVTLDWSNLGRGQSPLTSVTSNSGRARASACTRWPGRTRWRGWERGMTKPGLTSSCTRQLQTNTVEVGSWTVSGKAGTEI